MQFTTVLVEAASILTLLSGLAVVSGATKGERVQSVWFFILTIGTAIWGAAIGIFLSLPVDSMSIAPWVLLALYAGAPIMLVGFVGYVGWRYKLGRILTVLFCLGAAALAVLLFLYPELLYSRIVLSNMGNSITMVDGWYYWVYAIFCVLTALSMLGFALYTATHTKVKNERKGMTVLLVGTSIAAIVLMVFDLILPPERYDLIWIGPLATSLNIIFFYYEILRYHMIVMRMRWLKILSYIILMMTAAIIYIALFSVVFSVMFKVPTPSISVLVLNFVMVSILLMMMPILNELSSFVRSLISVQQVDLAYVVKKLNRIAPQDVDLRELAAFLADHLHFSYVGFLINGRVYGSSSLPLSANEIKQISLMKHAKGDSSVWQNFNEPVARIAAAQDINAIAELRDAKGRVFGQIIVGEPIGKMKFERKDLIQIEMIINLVAVVIGSDKYIKK